MPRVAQTITIPEMEAAKWQDGQTVSILGEDRIVRFGHRRDGNVTIDLIDPKAPDEIKALTVLSITLARNSKDAAGTLYAADNRRLIEHEGSQFIPVLVKSTSTELTFDLLDPGLQ